MKKPRALIRSKKLERKIQSCIFSFERLKNMYGSRIVVIERSWIYAGREDEPGYVQDNSLINELFREHPKVFYAYCYLRTPFPGVTGTTVSTAQGQQFTVSPTPLTQKQWQGFYVLNPIVAPAINLHATMPIGRLRKPQLQASENGPIYIGGKSEKEVLSVIERAERLSAMW